MATRRTTTTKVQVPLANGATSDSHSTMTAQQQSPYLPTLLEGILFSIYPAILVLGSLYSALHPSTRNATYNVKSQSYDPSTAPSYFAKKSNVFNIYFVKIGWLWATAAFLLLTFTHRSLGTPYSFTLTRRRVQALLRYASITLVWYFMTQWFFGPAIIDRSFRWTGGQCELVLVRDDPLAQAEKAQMSDVEQAFTHAACKAIGGAWAGGHDISGHVFLLILASAMLWLEALPAIHRNNGLREARSIQMEDGSVKSAAATLEAKEQDTASELGIGVAFALAVTALSWWMLLMTAAFFHTWFEKLTGSLVAFATLYAVYFLPRAIPSLRGVLGMPGV